MSSSAGKPSPLYEPAEGGGVLGLAGLVTLAICISGLAGFLLRGGLINPDTSWLLDVAERMAAGETLYRDVIDNNPPLSVLLYLPAVLAGSLLGMRSEAALEVFAALAALGSALLTLGAFRRAGFSPDALRRLALLLPILLLVLPAHTALQREHFALMLMLPAICALAIPLPPHGQGRGWRIAIGSLAGIGAAIKPPFALALMLPALAEALRLRSVLPLLRAECLAAATAFLAYAAAVLLFFPDYAAIVLPMALVTYVPPTLPLSMLVMAPGPVIGLAGCALAFLLCWSARREPTAALLLWAAAGFVIAGFLQSKGWAYHFLPALLCAALALGVAAMLQPRRTGILSVARLMGIVIIALLLRASTGAPEAGEAARLAASAEPFDSWLVVAHDLTLGFPATRMTGKRWAGRANAQWARVFAMKRRANMALSAEEIAAQDQAIAREQEMLREDIRMQRPDVIVLHQNAVDWRQVLDQGPETVLTPDYREIGRSTDGQFLLYRRIAAGP